MMMLKRLAYKASTTPKHAMSLSTQRNFARQLTKQKPVAKAVTKEEESAVDTSQGKGDIRVKDAANRQEFYGKHHLFIFRLAFKENDT